MFFLAKKRNQPEKLKKLQPTETKTVLNIIISAKGSQFLHLACQGEGAGRPLLPRLETGIKNQIRLEKTEVGILIPFN